LPVGVTVPDRSVGSHRPSIGEVHVIM